jgi:hypothetical protein
MRYVLKPRWLSDEMVTRHSSLGWKAHRNTRFSCSGSVWGACVRAYRTSHTCNIGAAEPQTTSWPRGCHDGWMYADSDSPCTGTRFGVSKGPSTCTGTGAVAQGHRHKGTRAQGHRQPR